VVSTEADSAVSMKLRKRIQQSQWDRGSGFSGVNETAEEDSAVSIRQQKRIQQSQWDRGILCDTAEAIVKTNIGTQFLITIAQTKIHTETYILIENVNVKGENLVSGSL
jgi:hypothetical protein